ncbi:MAG: hypothetical protein LUG98_09550 [Tannerellaceae bacterium]|nr:hypothetical protein [Tannerellaceae bacterium]
MFNSRQYEYADITVFIGSRDVTGLRSIKYSSKQEKELLYGKGNMPLSIQKGNKSFEGEIGLLQSELEALTEGEQSLLDLECKIVVTYGNPSNGDTLVIEELIGVQFTEESKEMKQGDKFMEITLPIIFLNKKKVQ